MSNDPNDRFMISDLSSKLSAYINGENSDQSSQTKDPADIEDVFASEIKSAETVRKQPGDELFTDLNQALDPHPNAKEETVRKQKLAEEQRKRQRAEEARRQQLRADEDRQQRLQEEQQRQRRLKEEQLRQQRLQQEEQLRQQKLQEEQLRQQRLQQEEQLRQQKLRRERALARTLAESLYSFDLEQPFTSVHSGHSTHFTKLSPAVKSMPSEEALKRALAKMPRADKASLAGPSYEVPKAENYHEAPKAETFYDAPKPEPVYEAQKQEPVYEVPQQEPAYEVPQSSTFSEPYAPETASAPSSDKFTYSSQPTGESRYAKSPDPTYRGYQEDRTGGSRIAVIIALLVALLAVAAIFIMIRRYSTNLTNLLSGTPAQGTSETVSKAESEAEEESKDTVHTDDSREADTRTDSDQAADSQAADSQAAASMAIHEEGEIYHSDSLITETDEPGESIPEDPNDITYLASVNEKAAEDAIAELSDAAPRLYLSAYGIKIGAGDSFNALAYVERIEDDADDKNRLYRDISVDGLSEFDAKVPGTYELTYFCYDSAGNRSNRARLTVIVE